MDYLGTWYLAIVVDELSPQEKKIHFLPLNSKRDEVFKEEDITRIASVFSNSDLPSEPEKSFKQLRDYLVQYGAQNKDNQKQQK